MNQYKKYIAIYRTAYVFFFFYLLFISLNDINLGLEPLYASLLIIIPFIIYCGISIYAEVLIRRSLFLKKQQKDKKRQTQNYKCSEGDISTALS